MDDGRPILLRQHLGKRRFAGGSHSVDCQHRYFPFCQMIVKRRVQRTVFFKHHHFTPMIFIWIW